MCTLTNEKNSNIENEALLAISLLKDSEISLIDAARLIKNALDFKPKSNKSTNIQYCSKVIDSGIKHLHIKDMSIIKGFKEYLKTKRDLRPSSLKDIEYLSRRLFNANPAFAKMNFSELSIADCEKWLSDTFETAPQFNKAHRMLNTFFNYALRQEWIDRNVIKLVQKRKVIETEIKSLSLEETKSLVETSNKPKFKDCKAGLALLLFAGIRPQELTRLKWQDIDLEEDVITIRSTTSKTGGVRHIEICKALSRLLKGCNKDEIVPNNWKRKWRLLRKQAGFATWTQDVLRHTYASYHVKHFQDLPRLQVNMGHYNLDLLRSRYINLSNISKADAKSFFSLQ